MGLAVATGKLVETGFGVAEVIEGPDSTARLLGVL